MQPPQTQESVAAMSSSVPVVAATTTAAAAAAATTNQAVQGLLKVSLELPLLRNDQLYPTPSMADTLPHDVEFDLRLVGCELIQTAGRLLKLPQTAMASAQVIFQRFYYIKSFVKYPMEYHAMAVVYLSSKIEECPRRIRDVMNVFHHIKQVRSGKLITPMPVDENYANIKNQVIKAERRMLKELGFCVQVKHPHKIIFIYLQAMECTQVELSQKAWNYMNDALRTDVFLRYSSEKIACACIYLSARELNISLPDSPPWYLIFDADEASIRAICIRILHLYTHKVRSQDELDKLVQKCRDNLEAERQLRAQLLIKTAVDQAKEAAAQHLAAKKSSSASLAELAPQEQLANKEQRPLSALPAVGSASSMLRSFEKTKSIQSSVMSATGGLNNGNGLSGPAGSRPSPPNPYYQNNHHHHHYAGAGMPPYRAHQNGATGNYQNGGGSNNVIMSSIAASTTSAVVENGVMKREKSSSHLSSMPYDENYDQSAAKKRYATDRDAPSIKSSSRDYRGDRGGGGKNRSRSKTRSRSRSRSPSAKKKPRKKSRDRSRSRDRSNSVDIGDVDNSDNKSSRHNKKKKSSSHHHRRGSRSRSRSRSRETTGDSRHVEYRSGKGGGERRSKERERDREKDSSRLKDRYHESSRHHHSSSKSSIKS